MTGWACAICLTALAQEAPSWEGAQRQFLAGQYPLCVVEAQKAMLQEAYSEEWPLLMIRSMQITGRNEEAVGAITNAMAKNPASIRLCLLASDVFRTIGRTNQARQALQTAGSLMENRPRAYRSAPDLTAAGQLALALGADPRLVLEKIFDAAKKIDPACRDVYLASGFLALDKHDFELASKTFQEGLKRHPDDPDFLYGLAMAFEPGNRRSMLDSLQSALERNTNHVPSMLLMADHLINAEDYAGAQTWLERARKVNPRHPEAWAYQAVLEHLRNNRDAEAQARENALKNWPYNPRVDQLIGTKLSQKYRFAEGAACQRRALLADPGYLPARAQLAQDLLRLGEEAEGWKQIETVRDKDGYDVEAFNLSALKETMAKFQTITNKNFVLRMNSLEAAVYGQRVMDLLDRAEKTLCAKYGLALDRPVVIEIFTDPRDFGVRTFGMPENPGFLGVCFGGVITANSPAMQTQRPFNFEAVLWHEFTHVITLQLTQNKMPRWLSEGISVYEERQARKAWGQEMNGRYREMILGGDLLPIAGLSGAFLSPKTPGHLDFAYYESSLAVEHLVSQYGMAPLKALLADLRDGMEINRSLESRFAPLATLEKDFAAFARQRAEALAPGLGWDKPDAALLAPGAEDALSVWIGSHPSTLWALMHRGQKLLEEGKYREAKEPFERIVSLYPDFIGAESARLPLARAHRALQETNREFAVLSALAIQDSAAPEAYERLMELAADKGDWAAVAENARRFIAVKPMVSLPHRMLGEACEALGDAQPAIGAYQACLQLNPENVAVAHFRLARLLHRENHPTARRHVLMALDEAPRYREALILLQEIHRSGAKAEPDPAAP
jgi:tetratricopeptide (TPR) repeat protein